MHVCVPVCERSSERATHAEGLCLPPNIPGGLHTPLCKSVCFCIQCVYCIHCVYIVHCVCLSVCLLYVCTCSLLVLQMVIFPMHMCSMQLCHLCKCQIERGRFSWLLSPLVAYALLSPSPFFTTAKAQDTIVCRNRPCLADQIGAWQTSLS